MIYIPILIIPFAISLAADRFYKKQVTPLYIVSISFISFIVTWLLYKFFLNFLLAEQKINLDILKLNVNLGNLPGLSDLANAINRVSNTANNKVNEILNTVFPKLVMTLNLIINIILSIFGLLAISTFKKKDYKYVAITQLIGLVSTIIIVYLISIS